MLTSFGGGLLLLGCLGTGIAFVSTTDRSFELERRDGKLAALCRPLASSLVVVLLIIFTVVGYVSRRPPGTQEFRSISTIVASYVWAMAVPFFLISRNGVRLRWGARSRNAE